MKHMVVLVLSHSINPQSCVPIGESGFAVFPCQRNRCVRHEALRRPIRDEAIEKVSMF